MKMGKVFCTACNTERRIKTTTRQGNRIDHLLECGHKLVELNLYDSVKAYDLLGLKKKGRKNFSKDHKWDQEQELENKKNREKKGEI